MAPLATPVVPPVYCRTARSFSGSTSAKRSMGLLEFTSSTKLSVSGLGTSLTPASPASLLFSGGRYSVAHAVMTCFRRSLPRHASRFL